MPGSRASRRRQREFDRRRCREQQLGPVAPGRSVFFLEDDAGRFFDPESLKAVAPWLSALGLDQPAGVAQAICTDQVAVAQHRVIHVDGCGHADIEHADAQGSAFLERQQGQQGQIGMPVHPPALIHRREPGAHGGQGGFGQFALHVSRRLAWLDVGRDVSVWRQPCAGLRQRGNVLARMDGVGGMDNAAFAFPVLVDDPVVLPARVVVADPAGSKHCALDSGVGDAVEIDQISRCRWPQAGDVQIFRIHSGDGIRAGVADSQSKQRRCRNCLDDLDGRFHVQ